MEWITVISLILFGLVLIVVEIIFVPGTTIVGLLGGISALIGLILSFRFFGTETGWITVAGSAVTTGVILYFSFKANVWGRFALKSSIDSKVNEIEVANFSVGQEGIALSALRPVGKAELGRQVVEVKTMGEYVGAGLRIRIIKLMSNQIIVEPIN